MKTNECADGYVKHKDYCILSSLGKCAVDGTNVITKNGICTESYICPKPDHLHKTFSNSCIPTCRKDFQGFEVKYDQNTNSCIKKPNCIDGLVFTNGVCVKKETDCSHLKHLLDPFSKQLNGTFIVKDIGCELKCDPYHKTTRTKTMYKYNTKEEKTQCYSSKNECYFKDETYLRSKKKCVKDIILTFINTGNSNIRIKVKNDIKDSNVYLVPKEKKKVTIPQQGNTYLDSETNVAVKILFFENNKVVQKYEQFLKERLPLENYKSDHVAIYVYTKTPEYNFKQSSEIKEVKPRMPHGIFTDYV